MGVSAGSFEMTVWLAWRGYGGIYEPGGPRLLGLADSEDGAWVLCETDAGAPLERYDEEPWRSADLDYHVTSRSLTVHLAPFSTLADGPRCGR